ncbi:MAG: shikimate kinase [Gammaproteobacteria bacterium]|nr:shikimate kinase [Gammaproteobacteria bacterium]
MGAGKTSIGRQLARALGKQFVDSDREIEHHTGTTISLLFELEGESGFRRRERQVIDRLTQRENIVLATGGGAVLSKENRTNLIHRGVVVYLHAPIARLMQRTAGDKTRPLLQTSDPRGRLAQIVRQREPLYRQVADVIVSTEGKSLRYLVSHIVRLISVGN